MTDELKMSVSSILGKEGKKVSYVLFEEKEKTAEVRMPDFAVVSNKGFSAGEIEELKAYLLREKDQILQLARSVNVMNAFMKN